jgi:MFS family permease
VAELTRRSSFFVAAGVVALSLWVSSAPTVTYPLYKVDWHLSTTAITALFAVYPLALALVLIGAGNLADFIGRRRAILLGLAAALLGTLFFAIAPSIAWAFVGRAFTGIGVGLFVGPATAAMIEYSPPGRASWASSAATVATSVGLGVSTALSGALIQYAPFPTHLSFWILVAVILVLGGFSWFLPRGGDIEHTAWRVSLPKIPRGLGAAFTTGAFGVSLSTAIGALIFSLGAAIAKELVNSENAFVHGLSFVLFAIVSSAAALAIRRFDSRASLAVGGITTAIGVMILVGSSFTHSLTEFLISMVVLGIGWSMVFSGGLGVIGPRTPSRQRASTLSAVYLAAYAVQAGAALTFGALATSHGLRWALVAGGLSIAAFGLVVTALALVLRQRERVDSHSESLAVDNELAREL